MFCKSGEFLLAKNTWEFIIAANNWTGALPDYALASLILSKE
jgi:hypothetical protein